MLTTVLAAFPSPSRGVWHLGMVPIRAYALCIIAGIIAALMIGDRRWAARGGQRGVIYDIALWAVPFGLIGGRLYHLMTDWRTYFGHNGAGLAAALRIWDGGLGIWGAIALGAVGAWIACRRRGIPLPAFADAAAPGIVLAQAIGRLGNYFNQELYGRETGVPWGLQIFLRRDPTGAVDVHSLDGVSTGQVAAVVQPTFLYELLWNLLVFVVLIVVDRRFKMGHGRLFALYVAAYCVGRFGVELLRDDPATVIDGLRINTYTSTFLFLAAVVYMTLAPKQREDPDALRATWTSDEEDEEPEESQSAEAAGDGAEPVSEADSFEADVSEAVAFEAEESAADAVDADGATAEPDFEDEVSSALEADSELAVGEPEEPEEPEVGESEEPVESGADGESVSEGEASSEPEAGSELTDGEPEDSEGEPDEVEQVGESEEPVESGAGEDGDEEPVSEAEEEISSEADSEAVTAQPEEPEEPEKPEVGESAALVESGADDEGDEEPVSEEEGEVSSEPEADSEVTAGEPEQAADAAEGEPEEVEQVGESEEPVESGADEEGDEEPVSEADEEVASEPEPEPEPEAVAAEPEGVEQVGESEEPVESGVDEDGAEEEVSSEADSELVAAEPAQSEEPEDHADGPSADDAPQPADEEPDQAAESQGPRRWWRRRRG